jgi:CheY-like chemotaxis protein
MSRFFASIQPLRHPKSKIAMRLLIVEDNDGMRRLIKSVVLDLTDAIAECADGADALKAYTDFHPDWVLMDIKMPNVDGLTATHRIIDAIPEARICIVTDYGDQKTVNAAYQAGAKGCPQRKPLFDPRFFTCQFFAISEIICLHFEFHCKNVSFYLTPTKYNYIVILEFSSRI